MKQQQQQRQQQEEEEEEDRTKVKTCDATRRAVRPNDPAQGRHKARNHKTSVT
jgi:hypothetical protein